MEPELPDPIRPPPPPTACVLPPPAPTPDCELLDRMLALARSFLRARARRQAMDVYWALLSRHPHTVQGRAAHSDLLQLAALFDDEGAPHTAFDIYQRLLALEEDDHGRR